MSLTIGAIPILTLLREDLISCFSIPLLIILGTWAHSKSKAEPLFFLVCYFFVGILLSLNALRIERGSSEIQGKIKISFPITILNGGHRDSV